MTDLQTASYLLINGFHWYLYGRLLTLFLGQRRVGCPAEAAGGRRGTSVPMYSTACAFCWSASPC